MRDWKFWLGVAISAACIVWAFWDVDMGKFAHALITANYWIVLPTMGLIGVILWVRALRWKFLLKHLKALKVYPLWLATCIGFAVNNLFPARIGEFARAYALARPQRMPVSATFATIVVERVWDGLSVFLLFILAFLLYEFPGFERVVGVTQNQALTGFVTMYAVILAFILFLRFLPGVVKKTAAIVTGPFPEKFRSGALGLLDKFILGFKQSGDLTDLIAVMALSLLLWILSVFSMWAIVVSYGIAFSVQNSLLLMMSIVLAISVPATPGYIGTYHILAKKALEYTGIPPDEALAIATMLHLVNYITPTVLGLFALKRTNMELSELKRVPQEEVDPAATAST